MKRLGDARDWFFEKRYGLFLHFGLYAIEGWHEQDHMRRFIPRSEYVKLREKFNPVGFDAEAILDLAERVGMEYVCLTTKHHDGFCLWDTEHTDYNVMNTPYGRDLVAQLAEACHKRDFPLGLYYSVADWHHPNYPNQGRHHELPGPGEGDEPDWDAYVEFVKKQTRELCTEYGPVHHFFWDINVPEARDTSINEMLRELQPAMVINNRGLDEGDFGTPERDWGMAGTETVLRFDRPTEACNSIGTQSWGYRRDEDYYSTRHLIQCIDTILAKGGNYLLNVGPDAEGRIPDKAAEMLTRIGEWLVRVREAFYGCEPASELTDNRDVLLTSKDNTLYVHLTAPAKSEAVVLKPLSRLPVRATLLNTGEDVRTAVELLPVFWKSKQEYLVLKGLPVERITDETLLVRLDFDVAPETLRAESAEEFQG